MFIYVRSFSYYNIINHDNYKTVFDEILKYTQYIGYNPKKRIDDKYCDIVFSNQTSGILFHEACGHSLELSKYNYQHNCFNLNDKVATDILTVKDIPLLTDKLEKFDDEGNNKKSVTLIDKGIVTNYLSDKNSCKQYNYNNITGNCRRESHNYYPESRMYCTFIQPGNKNKDGILGSIMDGLYIESISNANINHKTDMVECHINKAFQIKNGVIENNVLRFTIYDTRKSLLNNITNVGNDLVNRTGFCVSNSGNLCVEYMSPTISLKNINIKEVIECERKE